MVREELIARLLCKFAGHDPDGGPRVGFGWINFREQAQEILAALESRPAPTEERAREVLAKRYEEISSIQAKAGRADAADEYCRRAYDVRRGYSTPVELEAILRFATDTIPSRDARAVVEALLNTCGARGRYHAFEYGDAIKAAEAFLATPSRDEEGSVDREAVLEEAAQVAERHAAPGRVPWIEYDGACHDIAAEIRALKTPTPETQIVEGNGQPIDMLLFCPICGAQHIDEPDGDWTNPPHRSHLCHACGCIWRPADIPTNGVSAISTTGKADTWGESNWAQPPKPTPPERSMVLEEAARTLLMARSWMRGHSESCASLIVPHSEDGPWQACSCDLPVREAVIDNAYNAIRALSASPKELVDR